MTRVSGIFWTSQVKLFKSLMFSDVRHGSDSYRTVGKARVRLKTITTTCRVYLYFMMADDNSPTACIENRTNLWNRGHKKFVSTKMYYDC